jgi:hypothetical protein
VPEQDARLKCAGLIQHFKKLEVIQETREIQIG